MGKNLASSRGYTNPRRPVPVAMFNFIGRTLRRFNFFKPLEVNRLLRAARSKSDAPISGTFEFVEALTVLVDSINKEADLNSTGRFLQRIQLTNALVNHFKAKQFLEENPKVSDVNLGKIVLVAGLQRTGTTLLQRLLASHPEIRGISAADALSPVPPKENLSKSVGRSNLAPKMAERVISYLAPQFSAIHPVDSEAPEEDVLLLDLCFMSQSAEATMHVPRYSKWLAEQNHMPVYEFFKKLLQIQYWRRPTPSWVLKSPHHLEYLDTFLEVFPDATIVQTHRDPLMTVPSFSSMVCHSRSIFCDDVDPYEASRHWLGKVERMIRRSMEVRTVRGQSKFVDVYYDDLVENPLEVLRTIYNRAGIRFNADDERHAQECLRANPKDRFGKHVYTLSDFGLEEATIEKHLGFYREAYKIPYER